MTDPAISAYLRERARLAGFASGAARRRLRERVASGEATEEERERHAALCEKMKELGAAGGKARAKKGK